VLATAEIPGFLGNLTDLYEEADAESGEQRELFAAWWTKFQDWPVLVGQSLELPVLPAAVVEASDRRTKLGHYLRGLKDKRLRLGPKGPTVYARKSEQDRNKGVLWQLRTAS
jgi:hypothetical protein